MAIIDSPTAARRHSEEVPAQLRDYIEQLVQAVAREIYSDIGLCPHTRAAWDKRDVGAAPGRRHLRLVPAEGIVP